MRKITDHKVNDLNEALDIQVVDERGEGNANHHYVIVASERTGPKETRILFQDGPIQEKGVNGISNEALMTIVIDRLRGFQSGEFACRENALALTNLEQSLMWLSKRTSDRMSLGVEGTNVP